MKKIRLLFRLETAFFILALCFCILSCAPLVNDKTKDEEPEGGITLPEGVISLSGTVTVLTNSTLGRKKIDIHACSAEDGANSSIVGIGQANLASGEWSLKIPENVSPVWFKVVITDETDYQFGKMAGKEEVSGADKSGIVLNVGGFTPPAITAFTLLKGGISNTTINNKIGAINQAAGEITFPSTNSTSTSVNAILDIDKLAAEFDATGTVYAGNVPQESGVTTNNYYKPVTFTVVAEDNARKTYTINSINTANFQTQGFPVLKIETTDKTAGLPTGTPSTKLNIVWNTTGTYTYIAPDGTRKTGGVDIKAHGNYSVRHDTKKSYSLKLNQKTGFQYYDYKAGTMVTLPAHKRWTLLAHPNDSASRVRTTTGFELGRILDKMGWQPHAEHVYFFLNGDYKGLYIMAETIKIDSGRLNIGEATAVDASGKFNGGWIVEMNNTWWYSQDTQGNANSYIYDDLYNFMTSHKNYVFNKSGHDGAAGVKQQGIVWSWSVPDSEMGWYKPDYPAAVYPTTTPPDNSYFPISGITLFAELDGSGPNSKPAAQWKPGPTGTRKSDAMSPGTQTLAELYPNYDSSLFVKMAQFIQDAEDAFYRHDYSEETGYRKYIDIDSFIDWQIALELCSNWEIIALNGQYMYFDPSIQKLKMGLIWDLDQGWQGSNGASAGFVRKTPLWYKEVLGWTMTGGGDSLPGTETPAKKDLYYVNALKTRWAAKKGDINTELGKFLDAQAGRLAKAQSYGGGNQSSQVTSLKSTINTRIDQVNTVINGY